MGTLCFRCWKGGPDQGQLTCGCCYRVSFKVSWKQSSAASKSIMRSEERLKTLVAALIVGCYPGKTMYLEVKRPCSSCWTSTNGTAAKLTSLPTPFPKSLQWQKQWFDPVFLICGELFCLHGLGDVTLPSQALCCSAGKLELGGKPHHASELYFLGWAGKETTFVGKPNRSFSTW